jgi:hypothetical protein
MYAGVIAESNPVDDVISFVNFSFQIVKQAEGQESDVLADVAN